MTQLLDDDVGKVEKVESDLISFKAFVIEGHAAAIGRARKKLRTKCYPRDGRRTCGRRRRTSVA
jgi:hypothetical protein